MLSVPWQDVLHHCPILISLVPGNTLVIQKKEKVVVQVLGKDLDEDAGIGLVNVDLVGHSGVLEGIAQGGGVVLGRG